MIRDEERVSSSFRDPSGYLFKKNGALFRRVNFSYKPHYDLLISSGLYTILTEQGKLISHEEVVPFQPEEKAYKIIKPSFIEFITYPYEWTFSQLKDAAILTLEIQEMALSHGMTLKDATAFNVTFKNCSPVFIDTLSFEKYIEGSAWHAYGQFCRHFLAPLLLMKYCDERIIKLLSTNLDGIPLDMASKLLPNRTYFNFTILLHIHLHARAVKKFQGSERKVDKGKISLSQQRLLVQQLKGAISKLDNRSDRNNVWENYYETLSYSDKQFEFKLKVSQSYLEQYSPRTVWDLGSNTGQISMLSANANALTISMDSDHAAVNAMFLVNRNKGLPIYPVFMDLTNPSPGCGWASEERTSLESRGPAEMIFAMALIHHLTISNNISLVDIAKWLRAICSKWLVIEFVPKTDVQVKKMLLNREDVFVDYNEEKFKEACLIYFEIIEARPVLDSGRIIYLMRVK